MKLWRDLLPTDYGIYSAIVIVGVLAIAVVMHRFILKKMDSDQ